MRLKQSSCHPLTTCHRSLKLVHLIWSNESRYLVAEVHKMAAELELHLKSTFFFLALRLNGSSNLNSAGTSKFPNSTFYNFALLAIILTDVLAMDLLLLHITLNSHINVLHHKKTQNGIFVRNTENFIDNKVLEHRICRRS